MQHCHVLDATPQLPFALLVLCVQLSQLLDIQCAVDLRDLVHIESSLEIVDVFVEIGLVLDERVLLLLDLLRVRE